jgi:hypothetical protein
VGVGPDSLQDIACDDIPVAVSRSATDSCDADVEVMYHESIDSWNNSTNKDVITRTWIAADSCGNEAEYTQTITTVDEEAPVATWLDAEACQSTIEIGCNDLPLTCLWDASDNCETANVDVEYDTFVSSGDCASGVIETTKRWWVFTDSVGNQLRKEQFIHVVDKEAPTWTSIPATEITAECDAIPDNHCLEYTDDCTNSISSTNTTTKIDGESEHEYTLKFKQTISDACSNSAVFEQTINVVDTHAPVLSSSLGWGHLSVNSLAELNMLGNIDNTVSGVDNCDASVQISSSVVRENGDCDNSYTLTYTYSATDAAGNTGTASKRITVSDNVGPEFNMEVGDIEVECDVIPNYAISASDNYDGQVDVEYHEISDVEERTTFEMMRIWSAEDSCGNENEMVQTATITDSVGPSLYNLPTISDFTIECDELSDHLPPTVIAGDNCEALCKPQLEYSETKFEVNNEQSYKLKRSWTATDCSDQTETHEQIIIVVDTTAPVLSGVISDETVACDAIFDIDSIKVTATDNCDSSVEVIASSLKFDVTSTHTYKLKFSWSATDVNGNKAESITIITVSDDVAPTLEIPDHASMECDEFAEFLEYFNENKDQHLADSITVSDNCEAAEELTTSVTEGEHELAAEECDNTFAVDFTFSAQDDAGHITSIKQTFTITDTTDPVLTGLPSGDETVEAGSDVPTYEVSVGDNCQSTDDMEVVFSEEKTETNAFHYDLDRTWYAHDTCGNNVTFAQKVAVRDTTAPEMIFLLDNIESGSFSQKPTADDYKLCYWISKKKILSRFLVLTSYHMMMLSMKSLMSIPLPKS